MTGVALFSMNKRYHWYCHVVYLPLLVIKLQLLGENRAAEWPACRFKPPGNYFGRNSSQKMSYLTCTSISAYKTATVFCLALLKTGVCSKISNYNLFIYCSGHDPDLLSSLNLMSSLPLKQFLRCSVMNLRHCKNRKGRIALFQI